MGVGDTDTEVKELAVAMFVWVAQLLLVCPVKNEAEGEEERDGE